MIVSGLVSASSTAIKSYQDTGKIDVAKTAGAFLIGAATANYGGDGLAHGAKNAAQIRIINSNMHCIFRSSASNAVKRSVNYLSLDIAKQFSRFVVSSVAGNTLSALTSGGQ